MKIINELRPKEVLALAMEIERNNAARLESMLVGLIVNERTNDG